MFLPPDQVRSVHPVTGQIVWSGPAASPAAVDDAVQAARLAWPAWAEKPLEEREAVLERYATALERSGARLASAISAETGKPPWEAKQEVRSMIGKIALSRQAHRERCAETERGGAVTRFRPHGVVCVLGPFNFPGHLPNGHIVPALLAGNAVIFKPSEHGTLTASIMGECWTAAELPVNLLTVLPGGAPTGRAAAFHPEVNGVFFTGGTTAGLALAEGLARTGKILALEMGGNNPIVVWEPAEPRAAALHIALSAYLSAGQRCTCARRLILAHDAGGQAVIEALLDLLPRLRVGGPEEQPEPFMGPVITAEVADRLLRTQEELIGLGARPLLMARWLRPGTGLLSPGLLDLTDVPPAQRPDEEWFGPLLTIAKVGTFAEALAEAGRTRYGLAAGLLGGTESHWRLFRNSVRAGVMAWNRPLTGASGAAPFGGLGLSGNHRPGAYLAADYCSHPVAAQESPALTVPPQLPPGLAV